MANIFELNDLVSPDDRWSLSNRATDVFIDLMVLAGSQVAKTDAEKELIVWLAEHDQTFIGDGTVGFSLVDMPWQREEFENQKKFLLEVIDKAESVDFSDILFYTPNMEIMNPFLEFIRENLLKLTPEIANFQSRTTWIRNSEESDPIKCGFPKCEKHGALRSCFGCRFCDP